MLIRYITSHELVDLKRYRKCRNIDDTLKFGDLAIVHQITKLKTANIYFVQMKTMTIHITNTKLKVCQH